MITRLVPTPLGDARVHSAQPGDGAPRATLVLGHGAGGGIEARDLAAIAASAPAAGIRVLLVEQPWRVAGKRVAPAPARLDAAWRAVLAALTPELAGAPVIVGGRSAGARVACRFAADPMLPVAGVLALAFPLHPPGRPANSRAAELDGVPAAVPVLVIQGTRDAFGTPDEVRTATSRAHLEVIEVPGADHGFKVPARGELSPHAALDLIASAATAFCAAVSLATAIRAAQGESAPNLYRAKAFGSCVRPEVDLDDNATLSDLMDR